MNGRDLRDIALDVMANAGYGLDPFVIRVLPANLMPNSWGRHHRRQDGTHVIELTRMPTASSHEGRMVFETFAQDILLHELAHGVAIAYYGEDFDAHGPDWSHVYGNLYRSWLQVCCRDDREW